MLKFLLVIVALMPISAMGADYIESEGAVVKHHHKHCPMAQDGTRHCVEGPVERWITDCDFGVECHHMQSGQHYTTQRPVIAD